MSYGLALGAIAVANMLAIVTPGPAFLLVTRAAASRSRLTALAVAAGVTIAAVLWAAAAAFGVGLAMTRFAAINGALQVLGGIYLIWLGLAAWREGGSDEPVAGAPALADGDARRGSVGRAMLVGVSLTLTNPKVVVYFSSIFVAMLPAEAPLGVRLAALAIVAVEEIAWFAFLALLFSQARVQRAYRRVRGAVEQAVGAVLVAMGARVVALARF
jgi:threonine/homoserine/homoserine lactone efflux protein